MRKKLQVPKFQLEKVYSDGSRDEPALHALNGIDIGCRMGRRGFLLTSAVGVGVVGMLSVSGVAEAAEKELTQPSDDAKKMKGLVAHLDAVNTLAFSPNGRMLASGSKDKTVKLWSIPDGKLGRTIKGQESPVASVVFTPDGKSLVAGSEDGTVNVWSTSSGKLLKAIDTPSVSRLASLALSPDGKLLATATRSDYVQLWSMPSGKKDKYLRSHRSGSPLAFSPDGKLLANGAPSATAVTLWSLPSGEQVAQWKCEAGALAFSPDSALLATVSASQLRLWSVPSGNLYLAPDKTGVGRDAVSFSPNGKLLAAGTAARELMLLQKPFDKPAKVFMGHDSVIRSLAFSKNSRFLASGAADGAIFIWEILDADSLEPGTGFRLHASLFDLDAVNKNITVRQYTRADKSTQVAPCGTPLPTGAVCTCNCVSGRHSPPASPPVSRPFSPGRSGGGGVCTCNKICTCVPIK